MKPVRIRPCADEEINHFADHIAQDNLDAAMRFIESVEKTFEAISHYPGIGSMRFAHLPMLNGLRVWPVSGFENHLIFYLERTAYIDVLRIPHSSRDIPTALIEENNDHHRN